jgi:hypothetical protein
LHDSLKNQEDKKTRLERALHAHEGLLSSFVKIKREKKENIKTLAPINDDGDESQLSVA